MKVANLLIVLMLALATSTSFAQEAKYKLSSHILDITEGEPAPDVTISLSKQDQSGKWTTIDEKKTDKNGRINDFLKESEGFDH